MNTKMLLLGSILLMLIVSGQRSFSQENWKWVNPELTGRALFDVCSASDSVIIIVGQDGEILRSRDGGRTWQNIETAAIEDITSVSFCDNMHGILVGKQGLVMSTEDGGLTWNMRESMVTWDLQAVATRNANVIAAGVNGTITRSTNYGMDWVNISLMTIDDITGIDFIDDTTIIMVGLSGLIKLSTDFGKGWVAIQPPVERDFFSVAFSDEKTGIIGGSYGLLGTTDGGISWFIIEDEVLKRINSVSDAGDGNFIAVGVVGAIKMGNMSISSWREISEWDDVDLTGVKYVNDSIIVCVGFYGEILVSRNGGESWARGNKGVRSRLRDITLFESYSGCIVGNDGTVIITDDDGETWVPIDAGIAWNLKAVEYVGNDGLFASGTQGIIRSNDAGLTWSDVLLGSEESINSIFFTDMEAGYAVGDNGAMIRTIDGGLSWVRMGTNLNQSLHDIYFKSKDTGVLVGNYGIIEITYNGGDTWNSIGDELEDIHLTSAVISEEGIVVAVGRDSRVCISHDYGASWDFQDIRGVSVMQKVIILADNSYAICTTLGKVFRSINLDGEWQDMKTGIRNTLHSLACNSSGYLYAVGEGGTIVRTNTKILEIEDIPGDDFSGAVTAEVYPFPIVADKVRIRLPKIVVNGIATIFIHDLAGRLIWRCVATFDGYGGLEAEINIPNLKPGIYYSRIYVDNKNYFAKMIVE